MPEFQSIGFWSESLINPARKNVPSYWTSDLDSEFLYYPQIKEQGNVTIFVYKIYNSNSAVQTYEIHLDGKTEYAEVDFGEKPAGWDLADHVLGRFSTEDRKLVDEAIAKAAKAVDIIISQGTDAAMNEYNRKVPVQK